MRDDSRALGAIAQLSSVRSCLVKSNRLFLSLMADGGVYEYERQ
jgi:hypothetical protein